MAEISTVHVAVSNTWYSFDRLFTYFVPNEFLDEIAVGKRVVVPFGRGNSRIIGIIFDISHKEYNDAKKNGIKPIDLVADSKPILNRELIELAKWLSENTFCTYFDAVKTIIPGGLHLRINECYKLNANVDVSKLDNEEKNVYTFLKNAKSQPEFDDLVCSYKKSDKLKKKIIDSLIKKGILEVARKTRQNTGSKSQKMVSLTDEYIRCPENFKITPKQKIVIDALESETAYSLKELCYICGVTEAVPKAMFKKRIIEIYDKPVMRDIECSEITENIDDLVLTESQQKVFDVINDALKIDKADCFLLHGVTGSGKTSVFKKLISSVTDMGKQAMLLLPEISLTPQMVTQFRQLFGDLVTVVHSGLSMGQRIDAFRRIKENSARIIIGTRSAIFAPAENLGIVIIDEEGDTSYKSESSPRYNAIDVAKWRARYQKFSIVLASATPSIESYYLAKRGIYKLLEMNERYSGTALPDVEIVDMNESKTIGIELKYSDKLVNEVNRNLQNGEQTILLLNRRGYNTMLYCIDCKKPIFCPNCSVPLTYHKANNKLMCHMCGNVVDLPKICPVCGGKHLQPMGFGTQKVEEQTQKIFPNAKILRLDGDTVFTRESYEKNIDDFKNGKYDILVGTQMVSKGLNFPNVTLVGVVSIDKLLYNGDFRSYERTFSLITQVVGRGGRGSKPGRAILQTYMPEHYIIKLASQQDYKAFYEGEIAMRRTHILPPICDICAIYFAGEIRERTYNSSIEFLGYIKNKLKEKNFKKFPMVILGPAECNYGRINNRYRFRIILKCKNTAELRSFVSDALKNGTKSRTFNDVVVFADINGDIGN